MRNLQRPFWTPTQTAEIYASPHDWRVLGDGHKVRIERLIAIAKTLYPNPDTVADLSCGIPTITDALRAKRTYLGDFAPGYEFTGPIEQTIDLIPDVDLFLCAETLEHLQDPDSVLVKIRGKAKALVCSVPICRVPEDDGNGEHYWAFDRDGFEQMLNECGWDVVIYEQVTASPGTTGPTYQCGLAGCLPLVVWYV